MERMESEQLKDGTTPIITDEDMASINTQAWHACTYCRHIKSQEGSSSNKHKNDEEQIHLHFTYISDHGETWSFASKKKY